MKQLAQIIFAICVALGTSTAYAGGESKQVCKDVVSKDGNPVKLKDGSVKQACKTIKVHAKHEGTEIPPKK